MMGPGLTMVPGAEGELVERIKDALACDPPDGLLEVNQRGGTS